MEDPPAKKRRTDVDACEKETKERIAHLFDVIDTIETAADAPDLLMDAAVDFLKLKALQRETFENLHDAELAVSKKREEDDKIAMECETLKYLKNCCLHSISICRQTETPHLLQLAQEGNEKGEDDTQMDVDGDESNQTNKANETLIRNFLGGVDPFDPSQKAAILAKLQQEIEERKALEKRRETLQKKVSDMRRALDQKKKIVRDLPQKLQEMERASLPLQKFFHEAVNPSLKRIGTERTACLERAESTLARPLYTLFYQLQSYLDSSLPDKTLSGSKLQETYPTIDIVTTTDVTKESQPTVVIKFPIPVIKTSGVDLLNAKRFASIQFEYDDKLGLVTAVSFPKPHLVHELFLHDDGVLLELPKLTSESETEEATAAVSTSGDDSQSSEPTGKGKRAYNWCNYIAGIHSVSEDNTAASDDNHSMRSFRHQSTQTIMQRLVRRVQSQTTLSYTLHSLSKKLINPIHDTAQHLFDMDGCNAKLESWNEDSENTSSVRTYTAVIDGNGSAKLPAKVTIDMAQYPTVLPVWEFALMNAKEQWGEQHGNLDKLNAGGSLYDDRLAQLERQVNNEMLQLFGNHDDADWLLNHQLARIIQGWSEIISGK